MHCRSTRAISEMSKMAWGEIHPGQNDYGTFLLLMIVSLLLPLALALLLVLIVGAQRCCVVVST
jgi:hypothetical protein